MFPKVYKENIYYTHIQQRKSTEEKLINLIEILLYTKHQKSSRSMELWPPKAVAMCVYQFFFYLFFLVITKSNRSYLSRVPFCNPLSNVSLSLFYFSKFSFLHVVVVEIPFIIVMRGVFFCFFPSISVFVIIVVKKNFQVWRNTLICFLTWFMLLNSFFKKFLITNCDFVKISLHPRRNFDVFII